MQITTALSLGITVPALLAAAASLVALVISKESKVSDARQAWISELRNELAQFVSLSRQNSQYWHHVQEQLNRIPDVGSRATKEIDLQSQHFPHAIAASTSAARIKLMLSAHELGAGSKALVDAIAEIQCAYKDAQRTLSLTMRLHEIAGPILEREWTKVRTGEPFYKRVVVISASTLLVLFLIAAATNVFVATTSTRDTGASKTSRLTPLEATKASAHARPGQ